MTTRMLLEKVLARKSKFIVVTGGVCSSLGKGVLISSLGVLLKNAGYSVTVGKMDPYLNVDPGTMSPTVHGEVFVTDDGAETDLDLGHYERALGVHLSKESSLSSGQIYQEVLDGERKGTYHTGKRLHLYWSWGVRRSVLRKQAVTVRPRDEDPEHSRSGHRRLPRRRLSGSRAPRSKRRSGGWAFRPHATRS